MSATRPRAEFTSLRWHDQRASSPRQKWQHGDERQAEARAQTAAPDAAAAVVFAFLA